MLFYGPDVRILIMKKAILTSVVALAVALSLAACKKAPSGNSEGPSGGTAGPSVTNTSVSGQTENTAAPDQIRYSVEGKYIIFKVSKKISLETDAWIGICLKGDYVYEEDADDNQYTYAFFDDSSSDASDYSFKVSAEDLEDGEYSMVLCNTDNSGYVIASWGLVIKNGTPEVDYSIFKINQKPNNIDGTESPAQTVEDDDTVDDDYYDESENESYNDKEDDDGRDGDDAGDA
jgi:hypothetical protein